MDGRKIVFIVNPRAGLQNCLPEVEALAGRLGRAPVLTTARAGHAAELARAEAAEAPCLLVACGGDGTLHEVVNGAYGTPDAVVAHFPAGTGNDFVRMLGDPDRFREDGAFLGGKVLPVDLLDCGGRVCLNVCSIGFDARVPAAMHSFRRLGFLGARAPYNLAIAQCVMKGIHAPYRVVVDGEDLSRRYTLIAAMNGQYYGGGFHPAPEARPDDGQMDVLLVEAVSIVGFARAIGAYAEGRHKEGGVVGYRRATELEVVPEKPEVVNLDGESAVRESLRVRVLPGALKFLVPDGTIKSN